MLVAFSARCVLISAYNFEYEQRLLDAERDGNGGGAEPVGGLGAAPSSNDSVPDWRRQRRREQPAQQRGDDASLQQELLRRRKAVQVSQVYRFASRSVL